MASVKVGGAEVDFDEATVLVTEYVGGRSAWAYPAYDAYPGSDGQLVGDADLLAPILLNVRHLSLTSYYAMQAVLPELNEGLAALSGQTLVEADAENVNLLADLLALHDTRSIPGIRLTTLSKVLHRKAPGLIPLYDEIIRRCYMDIGDPVIPRAGQGSRSWTEFTRLWLAAVQDDLRRHEDLWGELASIATSPAISPLRALDIVGWRIGMDGDAGAREGYDDEV